MISTVPLLVSQAAHCGLAVAAEGWPPKCETTGVQQGCFAWPVKSFLFKGQQARATLQGYVPYSDPAPRGHTPLPFLTFAPACGYCLYV